MILIRYFFKFSEGIKKGEIVMILLRLLMKVLLLPIMLVLFVLRVLVKIGIELSSIVLGGMMLIFFGCIINAVTRYMWPSMWVLIALETVLVMVTVSVGILDLILENTMFYRAHTHFICPFCLTAARLVSRVKKLR